MVKHGDKSTDNGQGNYDPTKSKDAGGGRHSSQDKGDQDDQGHEQGDEQ
jgi:hypothetical protein